MKKNIVIDSKLFQIKKTSVKKKSLNNRNNNVNLRSLRKRILNELNTKANDSQFKNTSFVQTNTSSAPKNKKQVNVSTGKADMSAPAVTNLEDAFTKSMSFLQGKNKTEKVKNKVSVNKKENVLLELPESLQEVKRLEPTSPLHPTSYQPGSKEPAYGCMKGGKKPTYRTLHNTLKNNYSTMNSPPVQPRAPVNSPPVQPKPPVNSPPVQPKAQHKPPVNSPPVQPIAQHKPPVNSPLELVVTSPPETSSVLSNYYRNETKNALDISLNTLTTEASTVSNKKDKLLETRPNTQKATTNEEISTTSGAITDTLKSKALITNKSDYHDKISQRGENHRNRSRFNRTYNVYNVKKRVLVGKLPDGKVSVIINNNKTRRKTSELKKKYETKPLREIRKYLQEVNLVEPGSNTPEDVLRTMYSNARMSGNIKNINKQAVIDNYLNNEIETN